MKNFGRQNQIVLSKMDRLIELIKSNSFLAAERLLRKELVLSPNNSYFLTQLANVLWSRNKDEDALYYANKARELYYDMPLLNFTRGRILWSLEKYEESIEEWNIILNMTIEEIAKNGYGVRWAKSVINDSRYYKADCLYHLFKDKEALTLMEEHLAHRGKGIESDFSKKEAILFYKVLKYSHPRTVAKTSDIGYAPESQRNRILKKIDALEEGNNKEKLVRYLRVICKRYSKEYYLKTILSETYNAIGDKVGCLTYAKDAFEQEPNDPLVKYDYAVALMFYGLYEDALLQFEELVALGLDYIAFSEHGEGVRWAKKLLRDTQCNIQKIKERKV